MKLTLRRLQLIAMLAETAQFTRAADRLGMSQPALSRAIATFEEDLGMILFERDPSGLRLTRAGEAVHDIARQLLGQARDAEARLLEQAGGRAGLVRIGMGPLPAKMLLADLLGRIARERPAVVADCVIDGATRLLARLREGELDFCVCSGPLVVEPAGLTLASLGHFPLGLFARAGHPLAREEAPPIIALADFPLASAHVQTGSSGIVGGLDPTIWCDDFHVLRDLVLATDAIWLGSPAVISADLARGAVVELRLDGWQAPAAVDLALVRLAGRKPLPAAVWVEGLLGAMVARALTNPA